MTAVDALDTQKPEAAAPAPDKLDRVEGWLGRANQAVTYIVGLPVVTLLGSVLVGHFQYLSAYQDKVATESQRQITTAESTFTDIATTFSKALTLQQFLFFNFNDAVTRKIPCSKFPRLMNC